MGKIKRFFKHIEKFFVRRKQQLIMHHLLYHAGGKELIARYTRDYQPVYEPITETSPIWTCWWQGENAMPDIVKASPNAPITFAMEVEPSVATVPLVLPLPLQPTAAKQLIAVTAARIFTKSLLNVVFFMFVISF